MTQKVTVYDKRGYSIKNVVAAKAIVNEILSKWSIDADSYKLGLPEVDDRYHVWRIPVVSTKKTRLGEIVLNAKNGELDQQKSTNGEILKEKIDLSIKEVEKKAKPKVSKEPISISPLKNTILHGDAEFMLKNLPDGSTNLVFTSPPYFNARPDYSEYLAYEEYLEKMRRIISECARTLSEGRFFVMNISAVLIRRASRSEASRRIAVPFDLHRIFIEEGFDFIDDIIWEKPSGAGWATGRGRRFAADRTPLQYKAVPVTEYILVYRKHTDKLIDWNIRNHPSKEAVQSSKVQDGYEQTNIWRLPPAYSKEHPAIFPAELVKRVIQYYSFEGDVVLDPFAGTGTVGKVAINLNRRFALSEMDPTYIELIKRNAKSWLGKKVSNVDYFGCDPIDASDTLM
jgi:DNA modification methylase